MKRSEHHQWTTRLSDYLSDELSEPERLAVEAHLATCGECTRALEEMASIVTRAGSLGAIEPPRDLWPGISSAIRGPSADDTTVIELPTARRRETPALPERVVMSKKGLIAASVVLVAVSGTAAWFAGSANSAPETATVVGTTDGAVAAAANAEPPETMAGDLAALEDILETARAVLDPNTVRVLESNLSVIELAIADSREALRQDPGNAFLAQHLERMYARKLVYLQDAVRLVEFGG